jgi:hypothetical protein
MSELMYENPFVHMTELALFCPWTTQLSSLWEGDFGRSDQLVEMRKVAGVGTCSLFLVHVSIVLLITH